MEFFRKHDFAEVPTARLPADLTHQSHALGLASPDAPHRTQRWDPDVEVQGGEWAPREVRDARPMADDWRFVDGITRASMLSWAQHRGIGAVAVVGGVIGAMAARTCKGRFVAEDPAVPRLWGRRVVAFDATPFTRQDLVALDQQLARRGIERLEVSAHRPAAGLFTLELSRIKAHTRITDEMKRLERAAIGRHGMPPTSWTVLDGPLAHHVNAQARWNWPLLGVIKRHSHFGLPAEKEFLLHVLPFGCRTPVFGVAPDRSGARPPMYSWYLRLQPGHENTILGVVRVEVTVPALGERDLSVMADRLSATLLRLRSTDSGYSRTDCSLNPIIHLERRLHAKAGGIDRIRHGLRRDLRINSLR